MPPTPTLPLMVWLSLVPPVSALALAMKVDGPRGIVHALAAISWRGVAAAVYLGAVATVLAYAIWGDLLRRYPAPAVTPFALLAPFVAAGASAIAFGERFGPIRLGGMALLIGLGVIVLPRRISA
jgi:O-acetylserine/cysteine efflux transporter